MQTALIFDLDGTLWNACQTIAEAWEKVRQQFQVDRSPITKKDVESICGLTTDQVFKIIFPNDYNNQKLIDQCLSDQRDLLNIKGGELYPNVLEGIKALRLVKNLYIVSNCQTGYIETFIKVNNLEEVILDWACYGDIFAPKAENIKRLMTRNNITKEIYIGDTQGDKDAAKANDLPFVYCSYGFGTVDGSDYNISDFSEIKDINYA
jgi:phosphoglycolate phosphatase